NAVDHRFAEREVVELEDQVPGPGAGHDGADLVDVVAERGDDARAALLPVGEQRLEGGQEDVALLVLGEVEVRRQAAAQHEHSVSHGTPTLAAHFRRHQDRRLGITRPQTCCSYNPSWSAGPGRHSPMSTAAAVAAASLRSS